MAYKADIRNHMSVQLNGILCKQKQYPTHLCHHCWALDDLLNPSVVSSHLVQHPPSSLCIFLPYWLRKRETWSSKLFLRHRKRVGGFQLQSQFYHSLFPCFFPPGQGTCQPAVSGGGGYGGVTPTQNLVVMEVKPPRTWWWWWCCPQPRPWCWWWCYFPPSSCPTVAHRRRSSKAPLQLRALSQNPQQGAPLDPQTGYRALKSRRHQHHLRPKQCLQYRHICWKNFSWNLKINRHMEYLLILL